jgi:hypothetical protein
MLKYVDRRVHYGAPGDIKARGGLGRSGKIVDEVWVEPALDETPVHSPGCTGVPNGDGGGDGQCWGDYAFCAQLIEWDFGRRSIRLAYYRRRCGEARWQYASQMTVDAYPQTLKVLLEKTLAKSDWFVEISN